MSGSNSSTVSNSSKSNPSNEESSFQSIPAMIPLFLGLASLAALFAGFGMQFSLIGHGTEAQKKIDIIQGQGLKTILAVALLSFIGLALYFKLNQVGDKAFLYLFILVMVQLMMLHVAISVSLEQVKLVTK